MAISPNTNFSSGAVLTAQQQNNFPRGIMAFSQVTATDATVTAEEVQITGGSFTAVANRYYKITYYEPQIVSTTASSWVASRIRLTNLAGTGYQLGFVQLTAGVTNAFINCQWVGTLTAGTTNFVATLQSTTGNASATRSVNSPAFLLVEDLGPA
jgi:hypothetical protein